ncbi:molybdenum cofactor guanylyltransferase MobA [Dongia sp.]|uniref:molybdenum cofactor guanylyltransferase MobA n=1 Tax=Dongia sp. TaxID=1977262 RepID=UPI0035AD8BAA
MSDQISKYARPATDLIAILLAGGRASRMGGGDKCLRLLAGRPLISHIIQGLKPQVRELILNANGDPGRFAKFGLPVIADEIGGQPGPLAGILAGMDWAAVQRPGTEYILTVSTDCPFLPTDLAARLLDAVKEGAQIAIAASNARKHPVVAVWRVALRKDLRRALGLENIRKVEAFCDRHRTRTVNFGSVVNLPGGVVDPFFNTNTPEDLAVAEGLLQHSS